MSIKFKEDVINVDTQWGIIPIQAVYNTAEKVLKQGYIYEKALSANVDLYVKKRDFKSVLAVLVDTTFQYARRQKIQPIWYKAAKAEILSFKNEEFLIDKFSKTEFFETKTFEDWLYLLGYTQVCVGDHYQVAEDIRTCSKKVLTKGNMLQLEEITPTQLKVKTKDNYSYSLVISMLQGKLKEVV